MVVILVVLAAAAGPRTDLVLTGTTCVGPLLLFFLLGQDMRNHQRSCVTGANSAADRVRSLQHGHNRTMNTNSVLQDLHHTPAAVGAQPAAQQMLDHYYY